MNGPCFSLNPQVDALPWQPLSAGFHMKLLKGSTSDDDARVLLLHLTPGTTIPRHRHSGEVHALNLSGTRQLFPSGQFVGPGAYVFEPKGNVDSWQAVGETPVVVYAVVWGTLEYLGEHDEVLSVSSTASISKSYARFVEGAP